jgi:hypothetical protein
MEGSWKSESGRGWRALRGSTADGFVRIAARGVTPRT